MDIQEAIRKKRTEIQRLKDAIFKLEELEKDLAALERTASILGIEISAASPVRVRSQSTIALVIEILKATEAPYLHVDKLLEALKERGVNATKVSLVGTLAKYQKKGRIFSRGPEPNTFGLIEKDRPATTQSVEIDTTAVNGSLRLSTPMNGQSL